MQPCKFVPEKTGQLACARQSDAVVEISCEMRPPLHRMQHIGRRRERAKYAAGNVSAAEGLCNREVDMEIMRAEAYQPIIQ